MREQLSIIIPTLNAAETLTACLDRLTGVHEIIIVDGGSSDGCRRIALQRGAKWLPSSRGRGVQLHNGAEAAAGDWLLFLHADTLLSLDWRTAVERHMLEAPDAAGYFRFRLKSAAWQARLVEIGVLLRVRVLGIPYGDQALLIRKDLYDSLGGYKPLPLLEDVDLVRRLSRRRLRRLAAEAMTSAARWQRDGWFARSARNVVCLALYLAGARPERIATLYKGPASNRFDLPVAASAELPRRL